MKSIIFSAVILVSVSGVSRNVRRVASTKERCGETANQRGLPRVKSDFQELVMLQECDVFASAMHSQQSG